MLYLVRICTRNDGYLNRSLYDVNEHIEIYAKVNDPSVIIKQFLTTYSQNVTVHI